jgi:hypothetical protein
MIKTKVELILLVLGAAVYLAVAHYGKDVVAARVQCELHPDTCPDDDN